MGLDLPLLEQYQRFAIGLAHGDLGLSFLTKRPVNDDIRETFAATFELVLATIVIAFVAGVPLGVVAATNKDGWIDNSVRLLTIFGAVMPSFLLALLLQVLAGYVLHILPTTGRITPDSPVIANITGLYLVDTLLKGDLAGFVDALKHLFLPAIALSAVTTGQIARITRASMIDVAKHDYVEAARAFGVPDSVRIFKYMLRPAFVPPMTILGLEFASLIGNAFVVELVFSWPGMASYGVRSILQKDLNALMGVVMISGLFFVVANLTDRRARRRRRSSRPHPGNARVSRASVEVATTSRRWRRFRRNPTATIGLAIVVVVVLAALFAPGSRPYPDHVGAVVNFRARHQPPSAQYWFGTDNVGRDILTRVLFGYRISLILAVTVLSFAVPVGVVLGLLAGYFGGWTRDRRHAGERHRARDSRRSSWRSR